ncbi:MAG: hypothetical protein HY880_04375, partial [Deltaproteobacteria bacterium]|nr:hypothetical protein [Deltaproteobacteria bacterium]
ITGNDPYRRAVSNYNITDAQITALARYIPITFEFDTDAGSAGDARDDYLLITLGIKNDATGTTGCTSYLTVSEYSEGVNVPFGPSITATQQNQPVSLTFSFAVPGDTGLNSVPNGSNGTVVVDGGAVVTISADIIGNTVNAATGLKVAVASATLYYQATAKTVTSAPASGYTTVVMTNTSGNIWSGAIPANDNMRVWYYIIAIDNDGNFDRDPEIVSGAYVYDQKSFNVCDVTPNPPTNLAASVAGDDVTLTWSAPTTYTTGSTIAGSDTLTYRIYRNGSQIVASQAALTYRDENLATAVYSYYVKALNSCATPGPNVSSASNTAATCVGASSQATMSVAPTSIYQGNEFTVTIMDCYAISGARSGTVETINVSSGFTGFYTRSLWPETYAPTIVETGAATGLFIKEIDTTGDVGESGKLHVLASDTVTVYYPYASTPSILVTVVVDPCNNTPKAPTNLRDNGTSGNTLRFRWDAVTQNTDNSAITDLAGYKVYEKVTNNSDVLVRDWFLRTSVGSGTTSTTLSADQGNLNQRKYYLKITAYDSCATSIESAYSNTWMETQ